MRELQTAGPRTDESIRNMHDSDDKPNPDESISAEVSPYEGAKSGSQIMSSQIVIVGGNRAPPPVFTPEQKKLVVETWHYVEEYVAQVLPVTILFDFYIHARVRNFI